MTMPMQESSSPIDFNTLMTLRNEARGRQEGSLQGAASRRLEQGGPQMGEQTLVDGKTPDELMLEDIQREEEESIEPPDIPQNFAQTMMRYGAIQQYLMRARGELPGG